MTETQCPCNHSNLLQLLHVCALFERRGEGETYATLSCLSMHCQCPLFMQKHFQLYIYFSLSEKMYVQCESVRKEAVAHSHGQCVPNSTSNSVQYGMMGNEGRHLSSSFQQTWYKRGTCVYG